MIVACWLSVALAADPTPPAAPAALEASADLPVDPPANSPPSPEEVDALAQSVSAGLRCPVCQALSVADSQSNSAQNMKDRVRELVAAGYSEQQIRDYFVARYGEWVLLAPPVASNPVVWFGPGVVALVGLGIIGATLRKWRSEQASPAAAPPVTVDDEYQRRILAEMEK